MDHGCTPCRLGWTTACSESMRCGCTVSRVDWRRTIRTSEVTRRAGRRRSRFRTGRPYGRWGHCFLLYVVTHQTSLLSFSATILLSSIIREMSRNYNNYIQAFHWKDSIHENQERSSLPARREAPRRQRRREDQHLIYPLLSGRFFRSLLLVSIDSLTGAKKVDG